MAKIIQLSPHVADLIAAGERLKDYFLDRCSSANLRIAARAGLMALTHHRV